MQKHMDSSLAKRISCWGSECHYKEVLKAFRTEEKSPRNHSLNQETNKSSTKAQVKSKGKKENFK